MVKVRMLCPITSKLRADDGRVGKSEAMTWDEALVDIDIAFRQLEFGIKLLSYSKPPVSAAAQEARVVLASVFRDHFFASRGGWRRAAPHSPRVRRLPLADTVRKHQTRIDGARLGND